MTDHHRECETLRLLSTYCPCICAQLDFHSGRAVVLAMDDLHDKVMALRDKARADADATYSSLLAVTAYDNVLDIIDGSSDE